MIKPSAGTTRRLVWSFAVAETIVWAAMFYSFPAFLLEWERDLGWSKVELSSSFTAALVASAISAPVVGRLIDFGLGRQVFFVCGSLGGLLLILLSMVTQLWQFFLVWLGLGIAMSGVLYEACFAMLTRLLRNDARKAITKVALVAGFAGTLSFPSAHVLTGMVGWRGAVVVFAVAVVVIAVPLVWFAAGDAETVQRPVAAGDSRAVAVSGLLGKATFWLLAASFAMIALNHAVILTHLLPLLDERGVSAGTAVLVAAAIGPMQVIGRLGVVGIEERVSALNIALVCLLAMTGAAMCLLGADDQPILLFVFVLFQGAGYGVTSIMRPVIVAQMMGTHHFGTTAGLLAAPFLLASAAAPSIAAVIWHMGGYDSVIWFAAAVAVAGFSALAAAGLFAAVRVAD